MRSRGASYVKGVWAGHHTSEAAGRRLASRRDAGAPLLGTPASGRLARRRLAAAIIRRPMATALRIKELPQHIGEKVTVNGWLYNKRTSGKLQFPIIRYGSGYLQCVVFKKEVSEETWKAADEVTQESSVRVTGTVRAEPRAPGGVELGVEMFEILGPAGEYPISPKEHGTDFLMNHRHLRSEERRVGKEWRAWVASY